MTCYSVKEQWYSRRSVWTEIGHGWEHRDGQGFTLHVSELPTDGNLVVRFEGKARGDAEDFEVIDHADTSAMSAPHVEPRNE